ncbi:MAG: hypothetical protein ACXWW6_08005 [Candidatus Limnocylindrales bacterium]
MLRRWILANGVGELLGLGLGALAGFPLQLWLESALPMVAAALIGAVVFAGIEGAIVGGLQWRVLRDRAPQVGGRAWVGATMLGGLIAWLAVSLPFALMRSEPETQAAAGAEPPLILQLALMAVAGLAAGPILGGTQALALRRVTDRPWSWVWANARAWAVGLPVVQLAAGGMPAGTAPVVVVTVAAGALFVAGCVVGAIHGPTMLRLTESVARVPVRSR